MNFETDIFAQFDKKWAILTAGDKTAFNSMTISWGGMGTLWKKPVVTVYVKPVRYTYNFMEKSDYFTVSFYDEEYHKDLAIMGTMSGRTVDKVAMTRLTPKVLEHGVTYKQATVTLVCKKIYFDDLKEENIPDYAKKEYYEKEAPHRMYIGEVVEIIK